MLGKRKRAAAARKGWQSRREEQEACNRPKKLKLWSDESMKRAIEAVKGGLMGVSRASSNFGVPKTTLRDHISGRVQHGSKSGPQPYLTKKRRKNSPAF